MNELSATRNEVTVVSATKDFDGNSALTPIRSKTPEANPEGIFYQLQAEQQQAAHRRKHFFSQPPPILADAVNKDADSVDSDIRYMAYGARLRTALRAGTRYIAYVRAI